MNGVKNGISNFTSSISDILNLNYISVETKIHDLKNNKKLINFDEPHYFNRYKVNPSEVPIEFREFMADIYSIESDNTVLVIKTHKEGIVADFIVDEINVTQQSSYPKDDFFNNLKREAKRIEYTGFDESKKELKDLKVEKRIRKDNEFDFSDSIHKNTKANVIILYINEKYLITSDHNIYYAIMQELINVIN